MKQNKTIFLIFLFLVISLGFVNAIPSFDSRYIKWLMCDQLNLTKYDCDVWWENPDNPYYMQPTTEINETEIMNSYFNKSEIEKNYFNKTQILQLITSHNCSSVRINETEYYNKSIIDEKILKLMNNFSDQFVREDDFERLKDEVRMGTYGNSGLRDSTILIFAVIILGAIGFYFYAKNKKPAESYEGRSSQPRIHANRIRSREEMEAEEQTKKENNKKIKIKKDKLGEAEEDVSDN